MGLALVFPGQGSQQPGMARPWRNHPAFERWREADDLLGWRVSRLGTDATPDELREPLHCQVALFVHHAVVLEAWQAAGVVPAVVAGHSLGEYNALLAAGVLDYPGALRLVEARARATQAAARERPGHMAACLGFDTEELGELCARAGCFVANLNAPGQVVVAGSAEALDDLRAMLAGRRGRIVDLDVGAAYHSPHMTAALRRFLPTLAAAAFRDAAVPVVANVDGNPHTRAEEWRDLLSRQIVFPVRWTDTMATFEGLGVTAVVELAASPVLGPLFKRAVPAMRRRVVTMPADLEALAEAGQEVGR